MAKIARENIKGFIEKHAKRRIIGGVFMKKNSSERKMAFRLEVKKYLAGGENNVERLDRSYLTVFDMNKKQYRTINTRTLKEVVINGTKYEII